MRFKFWNKVDWYIHGKLSWLPDRFRFWVCEQFDKALGVYDDTIV